MWLSNFYKDLKWQKKGKKRAFKCFTERNEDLVLDTKIHLWASEFPCKYNAGDKVIWEVYNVSKYITYVCRETGRYHLGDKFYSYGQLFIDTITVRFEDEHLLSRPSDVEGGAAVPSGAKV